MENEGKIITKGLCPPGTYIDDDTFTTMPSCDALTDKSNALILKQIKSDIENVTRPYIDENNVQTLEETQTAFQNELERLQTLAESVPIPEARSIKETIEKQNKLADMIANIQYTYVKGNDELPNEILVPTCSIDSQETVMSEGVVTTSSSEIISLTEGEKLNDAIETLKSEQEKSQIEAKEEIRKAITEYKELTKDWTLQKIIEETRRTVESTKDNQSYRNLLRELESSISLDILYSAKSHSITGYNTKKFKKEFDKFIRNLEINRRYLFRHPENLIPILNKQLNSEDDMQIFLFSLCKFFNPKGPRGISRYAVFIGELINNIICFDETQSSFVKNEDERIYRQTVIESIKKYIIFLKSKQTN